MMFAIMSGFLHRLLLAVKPAPFQINNRERLRAMIGAGLAIFITSQISQWMVGDALHLYWMVGSLGATALLVFLLPGSPLAQPYAAVIGNTVGAVVGILCAHLGLPPVPSTGLAVSGAMAAMFLLRCVHPPGVAVALFASLTQITDFRFALMPIFTDTLLVVLLGALYNNLTGKAYPYMAPPPAAAPSGPAPRRFSDADLDQALAQFNQALNISRSELAQVLQYAENATFERILGGTRCRDIMSRDPLATLPSTPQAQAWTLMHGSQLKALPIVDEQHHLLGIATASDFVATPAAAPADTVARGWRALWPRKKRDSADAAPAVGDIMTSPVVHAHDTDPISALIPLFAQQRLRHIPILDQDDKLCGIVTQSDLLQALYQSIYAPPA